MWLNLAASRLTGVEREQAVATRDGVAARMTPADLREAQRRARDAGTQRTRGPEAPISVFATVDLRIAVGNAGHSRRSVRNNAGSSSWGGSIRTTEFAGVDERIGR